MYFIKKIIAVLNKWWNNQDTQKVETYPDSKEVKTYPVSQLRADLEGPDGLLAAGLTAMTDGYKLGGVPYQRLFLVTLRNGQVNEIAAQSMIHAGELSERDYGRRNIEDIQEVFTTPLESPIDLNEELLPIQLPAFQACSVCLRPDLCASGRVCIDLLG